MYFSVYESSKTKTHKEDYDLLYSGEKRKKMSAEREEREARYEMCDDLRGDEGDRLRR